MKLAWLAYQVNNVIEQNIQEQKKSYDANLIFDDENPDWKNNVFDISRLNKPLDSINEESDEEDESEEFATDDNIISREERDNIILSYVFKKAYNPFILDSQPIKEKKPFGEGFKDTLLVSPIKFYKLKKDLFVFQYETSKQFKKLFELAKNNFNSKNNFNEKQAEELVRNISAAYYPFFLPTNLRNKFSKYELKFNSEEGNKSDKYLSGGLAAIHLVDKVLDYVWDEEMNIPSEIVLSSNWFKGIDILALPAVGLYNQDLIEEWVEKTEEYFLLEYTTNPLVKGFVKYFSRPEKDFGKLIQNLPQKDQKWLSSLEKIDQKKFF